MAKQAMGVFATNFNIRLDTMATVLNHPHKPLVQPRMSKYVGLDVAPHGF